MAPRKIGLVQTVYLFLLKITGLYGLLFVPVLVFAQVSGLVREPVPLWLAAGFSVLGVVCSIVLLADGGRPRFLLRPTSLLGGFLGYWFIGFLALPILGQILLTMMVFDIERFLIVSGLGALVSETFNVGGPDSGLAEAFTVMAVLPTSVTSSLAGILGLFARFERPRSAPVRAPVADQKPVRPPAIVRTPEHEAAVRAMRTRMAQRQLRQPEGV